MNTPDTRSRDQTDTSRAGETVGYIAIESGTLKVGSTKASETQC